MKKTIQAKGVDIVLYTKDESDYISLTDIARYKNAENEAGSNAFVMTPQKGYKLKIT